MHHRRNRLDMQQRREKHRHLRHLRRREAFLDFDNGLSRFIRLDAMRFLPKEEKIG